VSEFRADELEDLVRFWELAGLALGINFLPVHKHLKDAAPAGDESEGLDVELQRGEQLVRQTDGSWLVVSLGAILDFDMDCHGVLRLLAKLSPASGERQGRHHAPEVRGENRLVKLGAFAYRCGP
jgi:hypothetical protein